MVRIINVILCYHFFSLCLLTLCQQTDNSPRYLIYIPFTGSHHTQKDITPTVARRANYHTKCTPTLLYKSKDKTLSLLKKHLILGVGEFIIILPLLRYITIRWKKQVLFFHLYAYSKLSLSMLIPLYCRTECSFSHMILLFLYYSRGNFKTFLCHLCSCYQRKKNWKKKRILI